MCVWEIEFFPLMLIAGAFLLSFGINVQKKMLWESILMEFSWILDKNDIGKGPRM